LWFEQRHLCAEKNLCASAGGATPARPQISFREIGPLFNSSGGTMIHRLYTVHLSRWRFYDKTPSQTAIQLTVRLADQFHHAKPAKAIAT
jgi:hypothetical protein